jgi:2'-5' RNA ligase
VRLFLAVELDATARERLDALLSGLRRSLGDVSRFLRWIPAVNAHITLHFLGETDDAAVGRLRLELGASLPQPCFQASVTSLGVFPLAGPPKVVWMGVDAGARELALVCEEVGHRVRRAGLPTEGRAFSPHLTLARVRDRDRHAAGGVRAQVASFACKPIGWRVDHVTLFQSEPSGTAPRYRSIATLPLAAAKP